MLSCYLLFTTYICGCVRTYVRVHVHVYFLMFVFVMRGLAFHLKSSRRKKKVFVAARTALNFQMIAPNSGDFSRLYTYECTSIYLSSAVCICYSISSVFSLRNVLGCGVLFLFLFLILVFRFCLLPFYLLYSFLAHIRHTHVQAARKIK